MPWGERLRKRIRYNIGVPDDDSEDGSSSSRKTKKVQYRLIKARKGRSFLWCLSGRHGGPSGMGINPNQRLATYLHWMFRTNFLVLFLVMCMAFFALVIFFSALITIAGSADAECVRVGGNSFNEVGTAFSDAFALSWTTFSTVGYGSTYPALGYQNSSKNNCIYIHLVCSLEALIGVLYSGFCGAILFGKVLRIQSQAQVVFSDPIVIKYGPGVKETNRVKHEDDEQAAQVHDVNAFPVLEFRVANRLFGEDGGEIMDATLNVVANIDANDADPRLVDPFDSGGPGQDISTATSESGSSDGHSDNGSSRENASRHSSEGSIGSILHKIIDPLYALGGKRQHHSIDEDPSARLVSKQLFSKLNIEASDHPFFKRVWLARHVLDEHSPILKPKVRARIRRHHGVWPENLNSHQAIRDSLCFNQILVSMNGVSNVSASDVYAQKIYAFVDVNIGYQFVNMLYKDSDGTLGVDLDLINDVKEQNGGGGEPLVFE